MAHCQRCGANAFWVKWNTRTPDPAQIRADAIRKAADHLRNIGWSAPASDILALLATPLSPTSVDGSPAPDAGGKEGM